MSELARRWRLVLGRHAQEHLSALSGTDLQRDTALGWLYDREHGQQGSGGTAMPAAAGGGTSQGLRPLDWLGEIRSLFPQQVCERLQMDALNRYEISELLLDPEALETIEPSTGTLQTMLSLHKSVPPELQARLRQIAQRILEDLLNRLRRRIETAFSGRRNRFQRSSIARAANFDARATLRRNLHTWDSDRRRILAERLEFNARARRHLPWEVVLCVDQSGSMAGSVINSALLACVLHGLPAVSVRLILFDNRIVDLSGKLADPLDTLLSVQLGGGTDIARAVTYCTELIDNPTRTLFLLVTDFCEGGSVRRLEAAVARLVEARVRTLGITSLQDDGAVWYDRRIAGRLAEIGMEIGARSPDTLADWLAEAME